MFFNIIKVYIQHYIKHYTVLYNDAKICQGFLGDKEVLRIQQEDILFHIKNERKFQIQWLRQEDQGQVIKCRLIVYKFEILEKGCNVTPKKF